MNCISNGTQGKIAGFIKWDTSNLTEDKIHNVDYVLVYIDDFTGPNDTIYNRTFEDNIVLIKRESCTSGGVTRSNFPFKLAYAITIHKAQGLSLFKVFLDLGDTEFALGLVYVGFSRVINWRNLFYPSF